MNIFLERAAALDLSSGPFKVLVKLATMVDEEGRFSSVHNPSLAIAQQCNLGQLVIENHLNSLIAKNFISITSHTIDAAEVKTIQIQL